ncbi:MAG: xanthine dehydrogenase subunit XdhB [Suipraeoptans sp.]
MYDFDSFYKAESVDDAISALNKNPDAVIISGGSDVLIKIREGKLAGSSLISIHDLPEIKGIHLDDDKNIVIGAAETFYEITYNKIIQRHIPILGDAVDQAGGPQLRKVGTIGGNVCNGATSADSASSLFVLNAKLVLKSAAGTRVVPIGEFYTGPGRTVRDHAEILLEIRIDREDYEEFYGHYIKYGKRKAMEIATLGCACGVKLDTDKKKIKEVRLAYGVAAPTPIRCNTAEEWANGKDIDAELINGFGKRALDDVNPRSSWRASKEFRIQLVQELANRALKQAILNAGGKI